MNAHTGEVGRDPDKVDKLNAIIGTEAKHRGHTISNAELINFFLARFIAAAKSKTNEEFLKRFNTYYPQGLGDNIGKYCDMKHQIEGKLSVLLEGYKFDEILNDLEEIREARNKMAHASSNRFQETMDKDISILQTTSFYLYQKDNNNPVEKIQMTDDDLWRIIDIVQRLQVKILTITKHVNPKVDTFSLGSILGF